MVLRKAVALSWILLACSAGANDVCELKRANADKVIKIQGAPGFFFKVHPDGGHLTFIESEHNTLLDLKSGKEHPTVGLIDPVWSPDGKVFTHPDFDQEKGGGLRFYKGNEILSKTLGGKPSEARSTLSKINGVYQSIGVQNDTYKVITDHQGVSLGTFKFNSDGPQDLSDMKKPCGNIEKFPTDLPMLSKDGRFLAVYDSSGKSTKIFRLQDESCELALDLGYGTGKVAFNNDSSQIAFHVDQFSDFEEGYFSGVGKDKVKNVVVLNLEEGRGGKLIPMSWAMGTHHVKPGDGGYYPDFDKEGNLYFLEDLENNFQIVKVGQKLLEFRPFEGDLKFGKKNCENCKDSKNVTSSTVLAGLWAKICFPQNPVPVGSYRELISAIDPAECRKMIDSFYVPSLGISKSDLLKTCPKGPLVKPVEVGEWDPDQRTKAEDLIKGKCIACHRSPKTFEATEDLYVMTGPSENSVEKITYKKKMGAINLDELDYTLAGQMLVSIQNKTMPKNDPLSDKQRKLTVDYLQKRMLDMTPSSANSYLYVRRYSDENLKKEIDSMLQHYPNPTAEQIRTLTNMVSCVYGQKNCDQYIADRKPHIEAEASQKPEAERQKYIDNQIMEIRCQNLYEVTPQDCVDWKKSK